MFGQGPERYKAGTAVAAGLPIPPEMAELDRQLDAFARGLRARSEVESVTVYPLSSLLTVFDWSAGGNAEPLWSAFGVSADLRSGACVDWWANVGSHRPEWRFEYSVSKHERDEPGCHDEVEFPDRACSSVAEFYTAARAVIQALVATGSAPALFVDRSSDLTR